MTQRFTGKERDPDALLDYFGARYHSAAQARFTSVDPQNEAAELGDPQSWNGYAYARSNPLSYVDPEGRDYHFCWYGDCNDIPNNAFRNFLLVKGGSIIYDPNSGTIRDHETELKIGSATWFNGDAVRRIENASAFLNFFVVTQTANMLGGAVEAGIARIGAGAVSQAAFQGGIQLHGRVAERIVEATLRLKGYRIVGKQVRVLTSAGTRVVDFIVEKAGELTAIEVKSMGAVRDAGQFTKDVAMATEGGAIKNAAGGVRIPELTGKTMKLRTIEGRPF